MKHYLKYFVLLLSLTLVVTGCSQSADSQEAKLTVAVSIVPQETFVREVAGGLVDVITMITPGNSPENYAPSPRQIQKLSQASIYFSIEVPAEKANILPKAVDINKNLKVVSLAREVAKVYPDREFVPGERDPHIWLSPKRVKVMIDAIVRELSSVDPRNKKNYIKNGEEYKEKLDQLDSKTKASLKHLENRTFIVYHPAFGYFADDYGLEMIALEEEGKAATPQSMQKAIDTAKEKGIKVIFYQAEIDSKQSRAFAEELGGTTEQIAPLAPNYIENMEKIAETFSSVLGE